MAVITSRRTRRLRCRRPPHRQSRSAPFLFGVVDARLGGLLERGPEQVPPGPEGVALTLIEDMAGWGGEGQIVHLSDEGDGLLDDVALSVGTVVERPGRHRKSSVIGGSGGITESGAYFQWHTRHRLACGDATDPNVIDRATGGRIADLLLTDPPYNVAYEGKTDTKMTLANDDLGDGYHAFLTNALTASVSQLRPGAAFYLWHADTHGLVVRQAAAAAGLATRQVLVWAKSAFALGHADYHWQHEPGLYGWAGGAAHTWLGGRDQATLLAFDRPARNGDHPTMKPVALFEKLIDNSCPKGGLVLDPFAGSGTTVIAAEQSGRTSAVIDLDPAFCDVVRRWETMTGKTAARAE